MGRLSPAQRQVLRLILFIVALFLLGTLGYVSLEGYTPLEAFYMTAITLTTTGFGEVRPLSNSGRLFTVLLLFLGVGVLAFILSASADFLLGSFSGQLARRRMQRTIDELNGHIIVCGRGRVGASACAALQQSGYDVVIIENNAGVAARSQADGLLVVAGDATSDDALRAAGVERAAGIVVCTREDAVNLFIVLSARALNSTLFIVARSANSENERKMRQAGADRIVSPHRIGGQHMANIIIRPHVTDFFDVVTLDNGQELWLEELVLQPGSVLCGQTIGEADVRSRTGVTIVAVARQSPGSTFTPRATTLLEQGDQLILLGTREQLTEFEAWVGGVDGLVPGPRRPGRRPRRG